MAGRAGALALVVLAAGCGGTGKPGPASPRNVAMEREEFVVPAPKPTTVTAQGDDQLLAMALRPGGRNQEFPLLTLRPLPMGEDASRVEVRRAAYAKARGKARLAEAEWLALALAADHDILGQGLTSDEGRALRDEAFAALAPGAAVETTQVLLASLQYRWRDPAAAATWQTVVERFPKSKLALRYREQHAWALLATDPAAAAAAMAGLPVGSSALYFQGWAALRAGDMVAAVAAFEAALVNPPPEPLAKAIRHELRQALAWRGAGALPIEVEARRLGNSPAEQLESMLEVGADLFQAGELAAADAVLGPLLTDPLLTGSDLVGTYTLRTRVALADRRLADAAGLVEALITRAPQDHGNLRDIALRFAAAVADHLGAEGRLTAEPAAQQASARIDAALVAAGIDRSPKLRAYDDQLTVSAGHLPAPADDSAELMLWRAVRLSYHSAADCFERALINAPNLRGTWRFTLIMGKAGAANQITTRALDGLGPEVGTCMERAAGRWKLPRPAGATAVELRGELRFVSL